MEENKDVNIDYQKPMPHDSDAEKAVLGSAFIDKDAIFEIVDSLK